MQKVAFASAAVHFPAHTPTFPQHTASCSQQVRGRPAYFHPTARRARAGLCVPVSAANFFFLSGKNFSGKSIAALDFCDYGGAADVCVRGATVAGAYAAGASSRMNDARRELVRTREVWARAVAGGVVTGGEEDVTSNSFGYSRPHFYSLFLSLGRRGKGGREPLASPWGACVGTKSS
jgi:hypothetical protein